jgi:hypothetical protein
MLNPPQVLNARICLGVKGLSVEQGAVPCQQHWYQVHAVSGVSGVHTN